MKIKRIEIQNFRSIIDPLVIDDVRPLMVFTGPNNVGKSNILKALDLFFKGTIEGLSYTPERDLPQGVIPAMRNPETTIRLQLLVEEKDINVRQNLSSRHPGNMEREYSLDIKMKFRKRKYDFWEIVTMTFDAGDHHIIIPENETRGPLDILRKHVDYRYIPSIKDARKIMAEQLIDEIKDAALDPYGVGPKKPQEIEERKKEWEKIRKSINELFSEISVKTKLLFEEVFPEIQKLNILTGQDQLKQVIGDVQVVLDDGADTSLYLKGSGIQTAAIIYFLKILATRPRQAAVRKEPIWAIEEPETFLHPKAQKDMAKKLRAYSIDDGIQTFLTTHSPLFICREDEYSNKLLEKRISLNHPNLQTTALAPLKDRDIWKPFREELGIDIVDTLFFNHFNLIVEGESDTLILEKITEMMAQNHETDVTPLSHLKIISCNGASALPKFFEVFYKLSQEARLLAILDNDGEGRDAATHLRNKGFTENKDFLFVNRDKFDNCEMENLAEESILQRIINDFPKDQYFLLEGTHPERGGIRYKFKSDQKLYVAKKIIEYSSYEQLHRYIDLIRQIHGVFTRTGQLNLV